jgi:hypothetical protein
MWRRGPFLTFESNTEYSDNGAPLARAVRRCKGESSMRKKYASSWLLIFCTVALFESVLVPRAAAQGDGVVRGQIMDVTGKPWADMGIQLVSDQGVKQDTKTDKSGNYSFRNLKPGV